MMLWKVRTLYLLQSLQNSVGAWLDICNRKRKVELLLLLIGHERKNLLTYWAIVCKL